MKNVPQSLLVDHSVAVGFPQNRLNGRNFHPLTQTPDTIEQQATALPLHNKQYYT
eukprot:CAMPEP_0178972882 /NCGR_PEP_ID=MMETSP0789-20121207/21329_1 /TAXON_ID=3005 /ORGANISM="Rhizosolenia setigera, Strain CCMP 1694" /LENGTH=54 /DNA_ID=CAMNT_0020660517 /DNA_START=15 /DNA_END=175 /DNA_ORIENTATION=-